MGVVVKRRMVGCGDVLRFVEPEVRYALGPV